MRKHGTLTKWNDDRGFGFITPSSGPPEVFVHISAFARDGRRPQLNELISYEVEEGRDGRPRAIRIMRPGQAHAAVSRQSATGRSRVPRESKGIFGKWATGIVVIGLVAIAVHEYDQYSGREPPVEDAAQPLPSPQSLVDLPQPATEASPSRACDGRTMCSQMTSCAEATWFIRNCPNTRMDGNKDGVPCEQQWCN